METEDKMFYLLILCIIMNSLIIMFIGHYYNNNFLYIVSVIPSVTIWLIYNIKVMWKELSLFVLNVIFKR